QLTVGLTQIIQTLADHLDVEDVAILDRELRTQGLDVSDRLLSAEGDAAKAISLAFLYGDREINAFAAATERPDAEATAGIVDLGLRILYDCFVVPLRLIGVADALRVLLKLGGIVGLGEQVLEDERVRDAYGPQIPHGGAQFAAGDSMIVLKFDFA